VIVVSHDRYFLNRVTDLLIVFANGTTEVVYGNYDTYELLRTAREKADAEAASRSGSRKPVDSASGGSGDRKGAEQPQKRKRKFPYRKVPDLEAEIAATERKVTDLEAAMQTPEVYKDARRVRDTMADLEASKNKLALLYQHWEEAVELNG
jgi:ATP-binding cassette subfamily F protein 3